MKIPIEWQYLLYIAALVLLSSMTVGQFIYPASQVPRLSTPVLLLGIVAISLALERVVSLMRRMAGGMGP